MTSLDDAISTLRSARDYLWIMYVKEMPKRAAHGSQRGVVEAMNMLSGLYAILSEERSKVKVLEKWPQV